MTDPLIWVLDRMAASGAERFYAKRLAPNDNSKNQVYFGGDFAALNIIPHGTVVSDSSLRGGAVRDRSTAPVSFWWMDSRGLSEAPDAKLILYPKYPEIRMSGFIKGCARAPRDLMLSRHPGRVIIFGVCPDGRVIGRASAWDAPETVALDRVEANLGTTGVFIDLQGLRQGGVDPRASLLSALRDIHLKRWIGSRKLGSDGIAFPYLAPNGGGYTLEAELGIAPNGYAEPDFLGWEVKQYGVRDFQNNAAKSMVTLMTPEPTGGDYREAGPEGFLRRYGYPDKSGIPGRINFGGIYAVGRDFHPDTGLGLRLSGYDAGSDKLTDMDGAVELVDQNQRVAASWGFRSILEHWNRKHAKAVYVPSVMQADPPAYRFGDTIQLCEGTDVLLFLAAVARGDVFYDPAIKMEQSDGGTPRVKRRSQFRIRHSALAGLYQSSTIVRV